MTIKRVQLAATVALLSILAAGAAGDPDPAAPIVEQTVAIARCPLRAEPRMLSPTVRPPLVYPDRVAVLEASGDWRRVRPTEMPSPTGWLHRSALDGLAVLPRPPDARTRKRIRKGEVIMAGRAFRDEVERGLKRRRAELEAGYRRLDEAAASPLYAPSLEAVAHFRHEGALRPLEED